MADDAPTAATEESVKSSTPVADDAAIEAKTSSDAPMAVGDKKEVADATATPLKTLAKGSNKKGGVTKKKSAANLKKTPAKKGPPEKNYPPGTYVMAKMKSYPPWPAIVLSEELLPEVLKRGPTPGKKPAEGQPASAWKTQFPILFMGTYEYAWTSSADLDELTDELLAAGPSRKTKGLAEAFKEVKAGFNLVNVKGFQDGAMDVEEAPEEEEEEEDEDMDDVEEPEEEEPSEDEKPKKKSARGKKRKKSESASDDEVDAEEKPAKKTAKAKTPKTPAAKTPKTPKAAATPKIVAKEKTAPKEKAASNGTTTKATPKPRAAPKEKKTPAATPATKKKAAPSTSTKKSKAAAKKSKETVTESDEEGSVAAQSDKSVLANPAEIPEDKHEELMMHRRHKLQKCFLNKEDNPPTEEEMPKMAAYLDSLEQWPDISVSLIRATKIHKVMKNIYKAKYKIPRDNEYSFRERCQTLWNKWNKLLTDADKADAGSANGIPAKTNGTATTADKDKVVKDVVVTSDKKEEAKADDKKVEEKAAEKKEIEKAEEKAEDENKEENEDQAK